MQVFENYFWEFGGKKLFAYFRVWYYYECDGQSDLYSNYDLWKIGVSKRRWGQELIGTRQRSYSSCEHRIYAGFFIDGANAQFNIFVGYTF